MFKLSIETNNAAFSEHSISPRCARDEEIKRILRDVAGMVVLGATAGPIRDVNGNHVGAFDFDEHEAADLDKALDLAWCVANMRHTEDAQDSIEVINVLIDHAREVFPRCVFEEEEEEDE